MVYFGLRPLPPESPVSRSPSPQHKIYSDIPDFWTLGVSRCRVPHGSQIHGTVSRIFPGVLFSAENAGRQRRRVWLAPPVLCFVSFGRGEALPQNPTNKKTRFLLIFRDLLGLSPLPTVGLWHDTSPSPLRHFLHYKTETDRGLGVALKGSPAAFRESLVSDQGPQRSPGPRLCAQGHWLPDLVVPDVFGSSDLDLTGRLRLRAGIFLTFLKRPAKVYIFRCFAGNICTRLYFCFYQHFQHHYPQFKGELPSL